MRAADESDFDWNDDILLDPYQSSLSQGRHEGLDAGIQSGFLEGRALGHLKGIEIGVELGYMHAFATMALDHVQQGLKHQLSESSKNCENPDPCAEGNTSTFDTCSPLLLRKEKKLQELIQAIEAFPTPDKLFSSSSTTTITTVQDNYYGNDPSPTSNSSVFDVTERMQRIRAKFQTLAAQFKLSQYTLKKIMDRTNGPSKPSSSSLTSTSVQNNKNSKPATTTIPGGESAKQESRAKASSSMKPSKLSSPSTSKKENETKESGKIVKESSNNAHIPSSTPQSNDW